MPEIFRSRDVVVLTKGLTFTPVVSPAMVSAGWPGGQAVAWQESPLDGFFVDFSDGVRGAGFVLWGSDEDSDKFTGLTANQVRHPHVVVGSGSWLISTRTFESYTLASRTSGPLVPLAYSVGDPLLWSNRGLFTREDEWTISGDPRAPNINMVGYVVQAPSVATSGFMTIQTTL